MYLKVLDHPDIRGELDHDRVCHCRRRCHPHGVVVGAGRGRWQEGRDRASGDGPESLFAPPGVM